MLNINRKHNREIYLQISNPPSSGIVPPPAGYDLFRAKKWGDPVLVQEAALSTEIVNTSNFQIIPVWIVETKTFSAVQNWSAYDRSKGDMNALFATQRSNASLREVFNPLIHNGVGVSTWWTGDESIQWETAPTWRAGCQLWGGQLCAASVMLYPIELKYPNMDGRRIIQCRKILPFRRSDFGKTFEQYPYLINRYTVAFRPNVYSETFNWIERLVPIQCLDPRDFDFVGSLTPSAFYIPAHWLETV